MNSAMHRYQGPLPQRHAERPDPGPPGASAGTVTAPPFLARPVPNPDLPPPTASRAAHSLAARGASCLPDSGRGQRIIGASTRELATSPAATFPSMRSATSKPAPSVTRRH